MSSSLLDFQPVPYDMSPVDYTANRETLTASPCSADPWPWCLGCTQPSRLEPPTWTVQQGRGQPIEAGDTVETNTKIDEGKRTVSHGSADSFVLLWVMASLSQCGIGGPSGWYSVALVA